MGDKERLIEQHLGLVHALARKLKRQLAKHMEVEDLEAYGTQGLLEAAERFDPQKGAAFATFAYYRIRGAMLDGLRTMGWYSRGDYARYRAEERANELLQNAAEREAAAKANQPGGAPTVSDKDPAQALESIAHVLSGVAVVHITSLEAAAGVADDSLPAPDAELERLAASARVKQIVAALPEKERRLMQLYYFEDRTLEEAGAQLGLSKSWACRLHARAVEMIRERFLAEE